MPSLTAAAFDPTRRWGLHPQVAVRPEAFGALLYHFGTRRLSFLKDPRLLAIVQTLPEHPSARAACLAQGLDGAELGQFERALAGLAQTNMLQRDQEENPG